jgi:hypothetical protein
MIRIVGVQKSDKVGQEFVLLQNQGSMRVRLRGHVVVAENALSDCGYSNAIHIFSDDVEVMPGWYVLLRTSLGEPRWSSTSEGQRVFYTYMNRESPVWQDTEGHLHLLAPQHSFMERSAEAVLV